MSNLTTFEKWYGRNEPPPTFSQLKAGALDLEFENGDLRYIAYREQELIRRIYVAIRDVNWNTIPGQMTQPVIEAGEHVFHIQFEASHQDKSLRFHWHASIDGEPDGTIHYTMRGRALSDFRYCRIGFCVLHPLAGIAGSLYTAETPTGQVSGILPKMIEPQWIMDGFETAIFPACTSLTVETPSYIKITTDFEGDLFETEDQRNWTDGSFKTYCTPIALGYPHEAKTGQEFYQKVSIRIETLEENSPVSRDKKHKPNRMDLGQVSATKLPKIGFGIQEQGRDIDADTARLLSNLRPDHLKAEIHFQDSGWGKKLAQAVSIAEQLDSPLELALFLDGNAPKDLEILKSKLFSIPIARLIVFHEEQAPNGTTSPDWMHLVRKHLGGTLPGVKFYGGTNGNFAELNRQQPDISSMDGVVYTINPQVHAFDERSLIEAIEGQRDTVITACSYSGMLPIAVSSVTLKPPFNQAATEDEAPEDPDELPAAVDQRQMSLFGAAWTTASLRSLAFGGVGSITYYQTTGWLGLMETNTGSRLPAKFRSFPGMVYPLYYIFEFLERAKDAALFQIELDQPLLLDGLAYRTNNHLGLILANLQPVDKDVNLRSLPEGNAQVRRLNEDTFELAASNPSRFLKTNQPLIIKNGTIRFTLKPYETVFIEKHFD